MGPGGGGGEGVRDEGRRVGDERFTWGGGDVRLVSYSVVGGAAMYSKEYNKMGEIGALKRNCGLIILCHAT